VEPVSEGAAVGEPAEVALASAADAEAKALPEAAGDADGAVHPASNAPTRTSARAGDGLHDRGCGTPAA